MADLQNTTIGRIFKAMLIFGFGTLVVKTTGIAKEITIANYFGLSRNLDYFVLAFTVITFFQSVISNVLQTTVIPEFSKKNISSTLIELNIFYRNIIMLVLIIAMVSSAMIYALIPYLLKIVAYGFSIKDHEITKQLIIYLLPYYLFATLNALYHSILQSSKQFWLSSITPGAIPFSMIVMLIIFGNDVYQLAFGVSVGALFETVLLVSILRGKGISILPTIGKIHSEVKRMVARSGVLLVGTLLLATTALVDQSMASLLPEGSISALNFGNRIPMLINSLITVVVSTTILPYFSDAVSRNEWDNCLSYLKKISMFLLLSSIPIVVVSIAGSELLVKLIFERGEFSRLATDTVTKVQMAYLLHIPPYLLSIVWIRMLNAMGRNDIVFLIALLSLVTNIILNYWLMQLMGVVGIALATAGMYFTSSIAVVAIASKILNKQRSHY